MSEQLDYRRWPLLVVFTRAACFAPPCPDLPSRPITHRLRRFLHSTGTTAQTDPPHAGTSQEQRLELTPQPCCLSGTQDGILSALAEWPLTVGNCEGPLQGAHTIPCRWRPPSPPSAPGRCHCCYCSRGLAVVTAPGGLQPLCALNAPGLALCGGSSRQDLCNRHPWGGA